MLLEDITNIRWAEALPAARPIRVGRVSSVSASGFTAVGLAAAVGDLVEVEAVGTTLIGRVVGLKSGEAVVSSYDAVDGLRLDMPCRIRPKGNGLPKADRLIGRVVNALGDPIDRQPVRPGPMMSSDRDAPDPLTRELIRTPFASGIRAIDTFIPMAKGQRIGVFAGSGVGKSTLLAMMVAGSDADVIVVGLVGERGREVREFIEDQLGEEGLAKSIVVVATGDESPLVRRTAAETATAFAEDLRDDGLDVLLVIDSITRFAMAHREIGLAAGELPAARGYPPSTMSALPQLLERAGTSDRGTITAIYTVLVDGDDMDEPVADAVRGIVDGHIVLSRTLANSGHFPAIDVLASVSRLSGVVYNDTTAEIARRGRQLLAEYASVKDLIDVGAYVKGANPIADAAIATKSDFDSFLRQTSDERVSTDDAWARLAAITETTTS